MHVPCGSSYTRHLNSALCRTGEARNRQRLAAEEAAQARGFVFTVRGVQLEKSVTVPVYQPTALVNVRRLANDLLEPFQGAKALGDGRDTADFCNILPVHHAINTFVWVQDVGCGRQVPFRPTCWAGRKYLR
jgi:hypothetical protein